MRAGQAASCSPTCRPTTSRSARAWAGDAAQRGRSSSFPVIFEGQVKAVIELASFYRFSDIHLASISSRRASPSSHHRAGMTDSNSRPRWPMSFRASRPSSPRPTAAWSSRRSRSRPRRGLRTNRKSCNRPTKSWRSAPCSSRSEREVERKNHEIEQAKVALEERAQQLASPQIQVEFLANMSHELRTPLNSLLIWPSFSATTTKATCTPKQVEFAHTICIPSGLRICSRSSTTS